MKNAKIKERFENAVEAFFDNEKLQENCALDFFGEASLDSKHSEVCDEKKERLKNVLKQVFLFFPGTLFLFSFSLITVYISIIQSYHTVILEKPFLLFLFLSVSFFMTWIGLGSVRKLKNMLIPLSVAGTGILIGAISGIISIIDLRLIHKILSDSGYPIYFLPLALTVPLLVKMWIEIPNEEKNT